MPLVLVCFAITDDNLEACKPFFILFSETSPVISNSHVWDTGNGIGSWSGTGDLEISPFPFMPERNGNAILIYIVIPLIIIFIISYKDKKNKKEEISEK